MIDDHELIRLGVASLIEDAEDMEVAGEASSGEEAIASPGIAAADIVLCDMMLPGIDGVETTRRLLSKHPGLRVLVLSGYSGESLVPALDAGAHGYILKNTLHDELLGHIREAMSGGTPISTALHGELVAGMRFRGGESPSGEFTPRQMDVLTRVARGEHAPRIAEALSVSEATVKRDLHRIFVTLGVNSRAHAVSEAQRRGIL
ncbi:MAG: response regulator [Chloroflexota bacterium]